MGLGLDLKTSKRLFTDPDLSRIREISGEPSLEAVGDGVFRLKELARSTTDATEELDASLMLALRTEKNDVDVAPGVVTDPGGGDPVLDSFSKALILWEIPDPTLTFLTTGLSCCWFILFKKAAPADTVLFSGCRGTSNL
jgi:hypothetical protein